MLPSRKIYRDDKAERLWQKGGAVRFSHKRTGRETTSPTTWAKGTDLQFSCSTQSLWSVLKHLPLVWKPLHHLKDCYVCKMRSCTFSWLPPVCIPYFSPARRGWDFTFREEFHGFDVVLNSKSNEINEELSVENFPDNFCVKYFERREFCKVNQPKLHFGMQNWNLSFPDRSACNISPLWNCFYSSGFSVAFVNIMNHIFLRNVIFLFHAKFPLSENHMTLSVAGEAFIWSIQSGAAQSWNTNYRQSL